MSYSTSVGAFARDRRGNVAILFGFALIPLMLGVGIAVDYGRALTVRERMADAADSAALAVAGWPGLSQAELTTKAQQYFDANYPPSSLGTVGKVNVSASGNDIVVSVSGSVPTNFMTLANIKNVEVSASSTVTVGMGTLEVALALDNSGSMQGSKIAVLKDAANDLVDILFESAKGSTKPDPIKISVVPFAAGVNVGSQYANASWMDTGAQNPYHADEQRHNGAPSGTNNFSLFSSLKDANGNAIEWAGCVEARPTPYDVTDESASTGNSSTLFVPMFAPDEPDNWTCSSTGSSGSGACPVHACASGGSSCSSSTSSLVYNYAPNGSYSYNNYLPDAGDAAAMCGNTFTVTRASPAVFTRANHGLSAGDQVIFSTTGSMYGGLSKTTRYYVISAGLTANTFRVSTSSGGSAVNTSGSQSGTHFIANTFTCRSGDQNCARSGSSGKTVGLSEEGGFVSNANCKYGTPSNKAKVANVTVGGLQGGPNFMCTSAPVLPLSTDKNTVKSRIAAMAAEGATGVGEGAMWGWRTLSSGAPFTEGRAYGTKENQKVLVLMTDGANTYYPNSKFVKSWYDVYGYVARGHLGTTSTNSSTLTQAMDTRTQQACTNIKAAGIIVYTVGFEISGTGAAEALALLKACASDQDKYFEPNSEAELLAAFNAIGKDISELRISK